MDESLPTEWPHTTLVAHGPCLITASHWVQVCRCAADLTETCKQNRKKKTLFIYSLANTGKIQYYRSIDNNDGREP